MLRLICITVVISHKFSWHIFSVSIFYLPPAFILWFGWYGFNTGSARTITGPDQDNIIGLVAANTTLAAASGCVAALVTNYKLVERQTGEGPFSLSSAINGCLGGLVSITGGCGVMEPWAAVITGSIGGLLYLLTSKMLVRLRIDDAVDAVPVHMTNGVWGTIAVGLFASPSRLKLSYGEVNDVGLFMGGNGTLLGCQVVGMFFVLGWISVVMFPFFCLLNYMGWFRAAAMDEVEGLDSRYHGSVNKPKPNQALAAEKYGHGNRKLRRSLDSFEENQREQSSVLFSRNIYTVGGVRDAVVEDANCDIVYSSNTGANSSAHFGSFAHVGE